MLSQAHCFDEFGTRQTLRNCILFCCIVFCFPQQICCCMKYFTNFFLNFSFSDFLFELNRWNFKVLFPVPRKLLILLHKNTPMNLSTGVPKQGNPCFQQGYKDSNLEMTESESVALPFGDSPLTYSRYYTGLFSRKQVLFQKIFKKFFGKFFSVRGPKNPSHRTFHTAFK